MSTPIPRPDTSRDFAIEVVRRLQAQGFRALWAGGCVRDQLLGLDPVDFDVATNARPDQVQLVFGRRQTLEVGASFGVIVVKARPPASHVEVATFRTEGPYVDGRRPQSVVFATPEEDAQRRDFTINGMFLDPLSGLIHDFVGGQSDLAARILRAIGDPHARFTEDKLRMLRAIRIAARFELQIEPQTALAIRQRAAELPVVSQERISQELKKILGHKNRVRALTLAAELHLLPVILPELTPAMGDVAWGQAAHTAALRTMLGKLPDGRFEWALVSGLWALPDSLNDAAVAKFCKRLKLSNHELDEICWLATRRDALAGARLAPLSRIKRLLSQPFAPHLLTLLRCRAETLDDGWEDLEFAEKLLRELPRHELAPRSFLSGVDLQGLNLPPGPRFKELLEQAYDAQLEGRVTTREAALDWLHRTVADETPQ